MSFKSFVLTSVPQHLYCWTITVVNAILPSSVGSNEILVWLIKRCLDPPMMYSSTQKGFFSSLNHRWLTRRENPLRSCLVDCIRKPKKISSSLNHRSFYSYRKPLNFLSRGLYEKTHKGFISKSLKLSVKLVSDLKERRELVWKFYYNYSWLFSATSIAHVDFHIKNKCFVAVIFPCNVFDLFQHNVPLRKKAVFP